LIRFSTQALIALLACGLGQVSAQNPPNEPSDFSMTYTATDLGRNGQISDGQGFASFLLSYPAVTGVQWGSLFMDYTNKREMISVGTSPVVEVPPPSFVKQWFFFDKNLQYLYNSATGECTKSPLPLTMTPFFDWLSKAAPAEGGNPQTTVWRYSVAGPMGIEAAFINNSSATPLFISWRTPHGITTLNVDSFNSGQPDASVFSLPAACAE
jgi:hypothetical protein